MHCFSYCLNLFLATVSAVTFGIDIWLGYSSGTEGKIRNVTNKYNTQIEPPNWLFRIWDVIYVLFIIWYLYVFLLLFRQLCCGKNKSSPLFPGIFWFIFIIINVLNGLWVRLYIKNYAVITGIILLILTLMLYLINMIAFRVCWFDITYHKANDDDDNNNNNDVERNYDDVVELSHCEVVLLRFTTLNGLPLYAMWCTLATAFQWTMIFQHHTFHWNSSLACLVCLSVLALVLLNYWIMDLVTMRKYFVYTWLTYAVLIVAFSAIISKYHSIGGYHHPGLAFVFALLIASCVGVVLKLLTLCCCPPKYYNPRFSRV